MRSKSRFLPLILVVLVAIVSAVQVAQRNKQRSAARSSEGVMPKFSQIQYIRPDLDAITADYEKLTADLKANTLSVSDAVSRLQLCYDAYNSFYTMKNIAELRYYHDVTDSYYADETDWFLDHEPIMDQLFEELCIASANCEDAEQLDTRFWGGWVVDAYGRWDSGTMDSGYVALAQKENNILAEYRRAVEDPTVIWRGEERSYWELEEDDSLSQDDWAEIRTAYYDKYAPILGEIYIRLVAVRQEQAKYLGFDSYEEYAYTYLQEKDYTPAEAQTLLRSIRDNLAPLYEELSLNDRWSELSYTEVNEAEILSALKTAVEEIGGTAGFALRDMEDYELYDIDISDKKGNVSYQCYLYSYDNPYLIVKTEGYSDDILSFGHEFGHFVDAWYNRDSTQSRDLSEVFSQGMEYLLLTRIPAKYQQELTEYKLLDTVDTFTQQASFAAFEHEVYSRPAAEWTPEALNELSLRLAREYGYLNPEQTDYYAKSWIDITHFFDSPFYVVSYCVSNETAVQIYALECENPGDGLDCWTRMLPRDWDGFRETLVKQGELDDPFREGCMEQIADLLREKLGS